MDCAGRCHEPLGNVDDTIRFFVRALERQREFPGLQTNACFDLGRIAVLARRAEHFDAVLEGLERFGDPFPLWHRYMAHGIRALILAVRGCREDAARLARLALESAAITDSEQGCGRRAVGLVSDDGSAFRHALVDLVLT